MDAVLPELRNIGSNKFICDWIWRRSGLEMWKIQKRSLGHVLVISNPHRLQQIWVLNRDVDSLMISQQLQLWQVPRGSSFGNSQNIDIIYSLFYAELMAPSISSRDQCLRYVRPTAYDMPWYNPP